MIIKYSQSCIDLIYVDNKWEEIKKESKKKVKKKDVDNQNTGGIDGDNQICRDSDK